MPKERLWSIRKKTEVLTVTVFVIPSINVVAFVVHVPHAPGFFLHYTGINTFNTSKK